MTVDLLTRSGIALRRAANPGPLTLSGTNSWVVGRNPAWIVDPGPLLGDHLESLVAEIRARGGAGGIAITHAHADHCAAVDELIDRLRAPVSVGAAASWPRKSSPLTAPVVALRDGDDFGPLRVLALPGHSEDHLGFVLDTDSGVVCFTGDAVLGEGSVFVGSDMAGYIGGLRRLRALEPALLCPGHGPVVEDALDHLDGYLRHRAEREKAVLDAWRHGRRDDALIDSVWGPLTGRLREVAAVTLQAHLAKLSDEGRID